MENYQLLLYFFVCWTLEKKKEHSDSYSTDF